MIRLSLSHHRHSGRLLPHRHTSYASLAFMLLLAGVFLLADSVASYAVVNPQSGSLGLSGTVPGPAPKTPAVIVNPRSGDTVTTTPITVSGTCSAQTYVAIYRNNIFAGQAACANDGSFNLLVDLLPGTNQLIAKITDGLGQSGPDSAAVTVTYTVPGVNVSSASQLAPFFLETDQQVLGTEPGQNLTRTVTIVGGQAPYALSWDFGDGTTTALPQSAAGASQVTHAYAQAGTYRVLLKVTDSAGNTAILQLVTVVNGAVTNTALTHSKVGDVPGLLIGAWPLYLVAVFMVLAFWLGERREVRNLRRRNAAQMSGL